MKSIRYIFGVASAFILMSLIYFFLVDRYVIYDKTIPSSYKQILLENLSDHQGKVIIIGGSDAHHGINAQMLEGLMKRPVINLGSNGNYPYKHYIYNLQKHVKKGDLVIAVMGWAFFFNEKYVTDVYAKHMTNDYVYVQFLYENLPFLEKIKFVFTQLPYRRVAQVLLSRPIEKKKLEHQITDANYFVELIENNNGSPRGGSFREGPEELDNGAKNTTCDRYLISNYTDNSLNNVYPSDEAMEVFDMLKSLNDSGVNVIFSWGIVVNRAEDTDKCYKSKDSKDLNILAERVRHILNDRGIPVLGNYNDYINPEECFLNTYAHIKRSCTETITRKLYKNGLDQYDDQNNDIDSDAITKKVISRLQVNIGKVREQITLLSGKKLSNKVLSIIDSEEYVFLDEGWSTIEDWGGVWTEGQLSKLIMKIDPSSPPTSLYLDGKYFNGDEETQVIINGMNVGEFVLRDKYINLPAQALNSETITVELRHKYPAAPENDTREIKFGLKQIGLTTNIAKTVKENIKKHLLSINLMSNGHILSPGEFDKYIYFVNGWSYFESWGIWAEGQLSKFKIKIDPSSPPISLYLDGRYFNGDEETQVIINDMNVGEFILRDKYISLPAQALNSETITVELRHKSPVTPENDTREIKFGLKKIGLTIDTAKTAKENISSDKEKDIEKHLSSIDLMSNGHILSPGEFDKYIDFVNGWSYLESWGVWAEGQLSQLKIKIDPSLPPTSLYLDGSYFNGDEETQVIINEINLGEFVLRDKYISLPAQVLNSETITVELRHKSPVVPKNDTREIKFGLKKIGLM